MFLRNVSFPRVTRGGGGGGRKENGRDCSNQFVEKARYVEKRR